MQTTQEGPRQSGVEQAAEAAIRRVSVRLVAVGEPIGNYRETMERIKRRKKDVWVTKYDGACLKHSIRHRRAR